MEYTRRVGGRDAPGTRQIPRRRPTARSAGAEAAQGVGTTMKVVLTADVKDLGQKGDVKDVADGYARNFLIPKRLATPATKAQLQKVQAAQEAQARRAERAGAEARGLAERIDGLE